MRIFLTSSFISILSQAAIAQFQSVQPLSGTAASTTASALKHGTGTESYANTIPAVTLPFGMTQWTPQTNTTENKCVPPYSYKDSLISGFRASHWLSGSCTQDYGSFTIMPISGKLKTTDYAIPFSHEQEMSTPAWYHIDMPGLSTEITATARCSMMQFTMSRTDSLYLLIKPNSDKNKGFVRVDPARNEITGYNPVYRIYQGWGKPAGFSGYFVIQIERQTKTSGTAAGAQLFQTDSIKDLADIGAFAGFHLQKGEILRIRTGTSFTSIEAARKNLQAEIPDWDFKTLMNNNRKVWDEALGKIKVATENEKDKRIFYTAFYHAMQHPRLFNDVDGTYPKFAGNYQSAHLAKGNYYDDFSMWDIYRAQLPLYEILQPALVNDLVRSLILKGQQGGWLPIFPCWNSYTSAMIGDHSTAFIASAYAKGIRDYDAQEAYRLMRKNAFDIAPEQDYANGMGRRALPSYLQYGYIPMEDSVPMAFHKKEQVSRTLEYAYDDYALSVVAKSLGKTKDYKELSLRAKNYRNIFDTTTGLVRGRYANGSWYTPFQPDHKEPYVTEGTPRQYSFYVPQDVPGLTKLMGGPAKLEAALDSLFIKNEYWHGNEPGHQIPFLYNYTPAPWKTQQRVRQILADEYSDGPGGLSGNDDAGQMSAWYIFAAMGFYPVDPVADQYLLCAPLFDQTTIQLPGAKKLEITSHKQSKTALYIRAVKLNGKTHATDRISHQELMQGGKLEFFLQDEPARK
ncbi:alpha-1,2-mannosidase, putative [Chitinophaga sp. CF118]|uniref:GH92 family glycosyl hydrolase n=1 Tax=Chitinophaga sp. CF118 TaxID=1884367 RepID=UPI0008E4C9EF|nr:GH92 family glycosyl hydrolase [Chitinophaga sp. CF118]SFF01631.1 alpha-1,2-mannosidase, putative [Chitinophaga sp. CF118]